ncbi:MAG: hypothetical protein A3I77_01760 [Gammaproteobacteria bacterium RIFCSPLOWO2_02_FULL_42_14]|nr:MAG: hypothetical protein A3B71_07945 [Gammaproteobacteria bacterium RIFCSPHIGHO2_02_FULL_42_43]OGT27982.1 MAG: hypothetical protein A2624_00725 [Gammaproteobacteria bacterium RIFCSPHIGHO2_01_FULL_42_8]OGT52349.1 MAG: hypothetical protein A3E54_01825 [Gammaproteobacteria bacterium RIFCSPHIGHO2_12_FULL_41_25]OGT61960.1 MAG: hypothetical protein A3I77_01760 [Gammaproteobacteria bacterium RIFCSPLOWO2_02_FULL_42_14]OGT86328.1 MAG: hypothetical protein A3G86_07330 [Gammaproteobacteria bacterium R
MQKKYKLPFAYFITFRTYGSWLHGDKRTSVSRENNIFGTPVIKPNQLLENKMHAEKKHDSIIFKKTHADTILNAMVAACNHYRWRLYSLHVRSNHVHLTIRADRTPEHMMTQLKAYATRFLRKQHGFSKTQKIWSRHGSTKYLWTEKQVYFSSRYTIEFQGQKMAYYCKLI